MSRFPNTRISLILRLADGADMQAWQEFADIYAPALYSLALRRGMQPADAEDVTQEILFGVARAVHRFQPDSSRAKFRTWLSRIARNIMADFWNQVSRQPNLAPASESWYQTAVCIDGTTSPMDEDLDQEIRATMFHVAARRIQGRVASSTWAAFEQTVVQGRAAAEVADTLGLELGNLYVARCRVMKMLRAEVEQMQREYVERSEVDYDLSAEAKQE